MAGNTFDFELSADDRASGQITILEDKIRSLNPALDEARDKLKLGGDDSLTGLRGIGDCLRDVADGAKDGVRNIGDMIPPLKNFGALAGKLAGIGGIGAIITGGYNQLVKEADTGLKRTTSAANTGMSVEESTRLAGTLQLRGVGEDDARNQMEGYYEKLSQAVIGKDDQLLASVRSIGGEIIRNKNGSVNLDKTLESLQEAIKKLPESRNWELRDNLKLTPDMIALLREGKFNERKEQADRVGLTVTDEYAKGMTDINGKFTQLGAEATGAWNKTWMNSFDFLTKKNSLTDEIPDTGHIDESMARIRDARERENDTKDNFYHGDKRKDIIAQALKDDEYKNSLGGYEKMRLIAHDPTDEMYKNIHTRYGDEWEKQRQQAEERKNRPTLNSKVPDNWVQHDKFDPNSRGLRNKNPGNLRDANNKIGLQGPEGDTMAVFASERDGLAAMSRQLMLDAEHGLNTIDGYIRKYAPANENKTQEYIDMVSKQTGFGANESLNMHDPAVLSKLMNAMIKVENGAQPFSYEQVMEGIMDSITDDRWKGLRNPTRVLEQRDALAMQQEQDRRQQTPEASDFKADRDPTQTLLAFTDQLSQVLQDNKMGGTLEIFLTNAESRAKTVMSVKPKGRVTTAMNMP